MKLSKRLSTIASFVPSTSKVVADIGADHGKLDIYLIESKKVKKAYAVENKTGPFSILKNAINDSECNNQIECVLDDGITNLSRDVDTLIIAGMGCQLILDILNKNSKKLVDIQYIIVDSHNKVPFLRKEIVKLGFLIENESIIKEKGHFYEIILFKKAEIPISYTEDEYEFGPINLKEKTPIFIDELNSQVKKIDFLLQNSKLTIEKINELKSRKERLKKYDRD